MDSKKDRRAATEDVLVDFDTYILENRVNPGLVASFRCECLYDFTDLSLARPANEWAELLSKQSKKTY